MEMDNGVGMHAWTAQGPRDPLAGNGRVWLFWSEGQAASSKVVA